MTRFPRLASSRGTEASPGIRKSLMGSYRNRRQGHLCGGQTGEPGPRSRSMSCATSASEVHISNADKAAWTPTCGIDDISSAEGASAISRKQGIAGHTQEYQVNALHGVVLVSHAPRWPTSPRSCEAVATWCLCVLSLERDSSTRLRDTTHSLACDPVGGSPVHVATRAVMVMSAPPHAGSGQR